MCTVPFSLLDDFVTLFDGDSEPRSIHLEVRVSGRIEVARLQAAQAEIVAAQPLLRAAQRVARPWQRRHRWQVLDAAAMALPAVEVDEIADDAQLVALRNRVSAIRIPLIAPPPFRLFVARRAGGDHLLLNLHHAAFDGMSCFLLLRALLLAYAGAPAEAGFLADPFTPERRAPEAWAGAHDRRSAAQHLRVAADLARRSARAPVTVARLRGTDDPLLGFGTSVFLLEPAQVAALEVQQRLAPTGASLNDVLVAHLVLAVREWNAAHGGARGTVSIMVPANLRPAAWKQSVLGNFASALMPRLDDAVQAQGFAAVLAEVARQTQWLKAQDAPGVLMDVLRLADALPWGLRRYLRHLPAATGQRLSDTTMLTNMGRLAPLPPMGAAGTVTEVYGSPPSLMPLGVGVASCLLDGRLSFGVRWQRMQFDQSAGEAFAETYRRHLLTAGAAA